MSKRCKHEIETKDDYPDDLICRKCETIWHISECVKMTAKQLILLPKEVRFIVLTKQAEKFAEDFLKENPNYYTDDIYNGGQEISNERDNG